MSPFYVTTVHIRLIVGLARDARELYTRALEEMGPKGRDETGAFNFENKNPS